MKKKNNPNINENIPQKHDETCTKKHSAISHHPMNPESLNHPKDTSPPPAKALVRFWGTRGTIPTPGEHTLRYGGNTSCVEVRLIQKNSSISLILDAGSGIAAFGNAALERGDREFHIFLSHVHYDHIIGLTRFVPIFRKDCKVTFYGMRNAGKSLREILEQFFSHPYFPVEFGALGAKLNLSFVTITQGDSISVGSATIHFMRLNHPQGACAFRVEDQATQTTLVYATDHEHGTKTDQELIKFAKNASLFIFDATYTEKTYPKYKGWGHSTAAQGALIAKAAQVQAYGLFHHDPLATDDYLEHHLLAEAQSIFPASFLCREGMEMNLAHIHTEMTKS